VSNQTVVEKLVMYQDHPHYEPVELWYYPNSHAYKKDNEKLIGVTTVKDIIASDGLAHYFKAEAIKYFKRKLIPMNDGQLVLPTPEEFEQMCVEAGKAHMIKSQRGKDTGTFADDWIERFMIAKRDGQPTPEFPERIKTTEHTPAEGKALKFDLLDVSDEQQKEYIADPWLYEADKQIAFERNNLVDAMREFAEWWDEHNIEVVYTQRIIMSLKYEFAGRFDMILRIDGKLYLVDIKTNNPAWEYPKGIFPDMFCQLGGYDVGYTEEFHWDLHLKNESPFDGHAIFNLNKQTGKFYREYNFDTKVNRTWFIHTLGTKRGFQHHMRLLSLKYRENRPDRKRKAMAK